MLVFAICSAAAAAAWQNHGDTAKQMISNWVPGFRPHLIATDGNGCARRTRPIRLPLRQLRQSRPRSLLPLQLRPSPRKARHRPPLRPPRIQRNCSRWRAISRPWRSRSNSSRPASPNSRRASKRWSAKSPERPRSSLPRSSLPQSSRGPGHRHRRRERPRRRRPAVGLSAAPAAARAITAPALRRHRRHQRRHPRRPRPGPRTANRSSGRRCRCANCQPDRARAEPNARHGVAITHAPGDNRP